MPSPDLVTVPESARYHPAKRPLTLSVVVKAIGTPRIYELIKQGWSIAGWEGRDCYLAPPPNTE